MSSERRRVAVLDALIDVIDWQPSVERILQWAALRESRYVCACNTHSVVSAGDDGAFRAAINGADMATADGMPVAWAIGKLGHPGQPRINGPDLTWRLLERAAERGLPVFFYGATPGTLDALRARLSAAFPRLAIAGMVSPPFRKLSATEEQADIEHVNSSGAALLFVGLGCPKQELWMARHRGKINAVMLGVGAAFDYHAGTLQRAPLWMQRGGLEWAYRLYQEPRRLWRRYLSTNVVFALRIARQLLGERKRLRS